MIQYVKSTTLGMRSGTSFVRAVKTLHGRLVDFSNVFLSINVGGDSAHFLPMEDAPVSLASLARKRVGCDSDHHPPYDMV